MPHNRLVLVSNRLPFQLTEKHGKITFRQSDGGLVTALISFFDSPANRDRFQEKVWMGAADFSQKRWTRFQQSNPNTGPFEVRPLFVDEEVYDRYYNGFCNATLWPLFHYFPSFVVYDQRYFEAYEEVNRQFADALLAFLEPGDTVWVHDYQLFLLPAMLRERMPTASIGFFLHIPFPSFEVFRLLHRSWKEKIVKGMLGADLIGFHTHEYVQHFLKTVRMVLGYDHQFRTIQYKMRRVKADLFPLGVDYTKFNEASQQPGVLHRMQEIRQNFEDRKLIFSVDRLDYTKGVTHRLAGFERFLATHPEWREKVVFILVVVPSRQIISRYNERRKMIEEQVGRINGKYSNLIWQPIIYRYSSVAFDELCALYNVSDVGLITPLRDGMNLVAKEYVASSVEGHGVLILSELAGAANELGEALLINPLDNDDMAHAISQALVMPEEEQQRRMTLMQQRLQDYTVQVWVNEFLSQLQEIKQTQEADAQRYLTPAIWQTLVEAYRQADHRCLLLDYDGTLVPFSRNPRDARPDASLLKLLDALAAHPRNSVTIVSGRDAATLEEWLGHLPVNLVAEHGGSIRRVGMSWTQEQEIDQAWKAVVRPAMEMFARRCPGAFIEEKKHTLVWHYRKVDPDLGFIRSRELLDNLFHLIRNVPLQVLDGNKVIEVRVAGVDKGAAARRIVDEVQPDFILAAGDDTTDEDMFRVLGENAYTIKIGDGFSAAGYALHHHQDMLRLLEALRT